MKSLDTLFKTTPEGTRSPKLAELQERLLAAQLLLLLREPTTRHVDGWLSSTSFTVSCRIATLLFRMRETGRRNFKNDTAVLLWSAVAEVPTNSTVRLFMIVLEYRPADTKVVSEAKKTLDTTAALVTEKLATPQAGRRCCRVSLEPSTVTALASP